MNLTLFKEIDFLNAVKALFHELKVPMNYVADEPTTIKKILSPITYRENYTFNLVDDVYFVGMVDDAAFEGNKSLSADKIKSDYDGVLIFGVTLHQRENNLLPTRSQLAEISRAFNREFYYTPVVLVFKYRDNISDYLAFANTERLKYKQEWREGEKAGKVSLLRDINIKKPHRGHEDIIKQLRIPTSGTKRVDSFAKLYNYWQEVFSVSILNKKFYKELQNWYFWAIQEVAFPNAPNRFDFDTDEKFDEALKEHKGKNVIRLLTRILFIWFIKEKKLIPEEIFDGETITGKLLEDFTPQKPHGVFATGKQNSKYYRAILQNLFFATLNQEMGKREFRKEGYKHQNVTNLMRYKSYFKKPEYFVQLMEDIVPFMNGGLFECLDKPHETIKGKQGGDKIIYIDGFSDRPNNSLVVPDYLFFDVDEDVDLSDDFGSKSKVYKNAKTRGLLEILKSYKFTITENTPIEEDVALDPELLGKVFENLLASYNPETKTTARKQTGSFYTPREIVNYMVDESLIVYLKNSITDWNLPEEELDKNLHQLFSFDETNPFEDYPKLQKQIIKVLDKAKILDPAVGSGAFPMGVLQKMVHILHKVDPQSTEWKQRQIDKVNNAIESLEEIDDVKFREQSIKELKAQIKDIEDAFENNELDYGRKLFLIENCIYGVDIQSIATQISKLRFFISLIVDQKIDENKANFGIRPLPNLETKFVAANTLIGIDKPDQLSLFDKTEVEKLESQLKKVRHKIFSSKSPKRKRELREEDKNLREQIAELLEEGGMENKTARQLASWDPYDQNASSSFFDPEWMFDIKEGFDVVIGNPPYLIISKEEFINKYKSYSLQEGKPDLYRMFIERSFYLLKNNGVFSLITPNTFLTIPNAKRLRKSILENYDIEMLLSFDESVFESASVNSLVYVFNRDRKKNKIRIKIIDSKNKIIDDEFYFINQHEWMKNEKYEFNIFIDDATDNIIKLIETNSKSIGGLGFSVTLGAQQYHNTIHSSEEIKSKFLHSNQQLSNDYILELGGRNINLFKVNIPPTPIYVDFSAEFYTKPNIDFFIKPRIIFREITGNTLISSYTETKFIVSKSCYSIIGNHLFLKNLQLIISSTLIGFWILNIGDKSKQRLFPRITKGAINKMPIKLLKDNSIANSLHDILSKSVELNNFNIFRKIQDAMIFNLYFPDHMKEREIDVLQFVERDIEQVMQGREFEKLSDPEKEDVIEQLNQKWTDPDNKVRNRIKLFAVRSPEILKPILESQI